MPKAVDIEDFAAKLGLVCKRLNWSRAKLAQQIGMDKSLVGRWLVGTSRPTGNSLMLLNDALAKALPDFTAATWDLGRASLAARFGIASPVPSTTEAATAASPTMPPMTPVTMADTLAGLRSFSRFADDIDYLAPIYAGFYRVWFASFSNDGSILGRRGRIWREGNGLRVEAGGGTVIYAGGCIVAGKRLYMILESPAFPGPVMITLGGSYGAHPQRLAGLALFQAIGRAEGAVCASPCVLEFLEPMGSDPAANQRRWDAMISEELDLRGDDDAQGALSPEILALLRPTLGVRRADGSQDHVLTVRPID